jgi:hypothetical protein
VSYQLARPVLRFGAEQPATQLGAPILGIYRAKGPEFSYK